MQFPKYLLSHHIIKNNSRAVLSFLAAQHLSLLPVLGNSLILWVLGENQRPFSLYKAERKQGFFHSTRWQPGLQSVSGLSHLGASIWNFISGASGTQTGGWPEMITATAFGCLAAAWAASLWRQRHQPQVITDIPLGHGLDWLSCPVYLGSCPFSTPGSLAFLLILWTIQYPFNNFLFLSLPVLVPVFVTKNPDWN